jgi:hypothetical protein
MTLNKRTPTIISNKMLGPSQDKNRQVGVKGGGIYEMVAKKDPVYGMVAKKDPVYGMVAKKDLVYGMVAKKDLIYGVSLSSDSLGGEGTENLDIPIPNKTMSTDNAETNNSENYQGSTSNLDQSFGSEMTLGLIKDIKPDVSQCSQTKTNFTSITIRSEATLSTSRNETFELLARIKDAIIESEGMPDLADDGNPRGIMRTMEQYS